jgi:deoxyribodipyrimidine photo-lyase
MKSITIFWFRRDLRLADNTALFHALNQNENVLPIFIFDTSILKKLENKYDRRVKFIHQSLSNINNQLIDSGSSLWTFFGETEEAFINLMANFSIKSVYTNHDYEPSANKRDEQVKKLLQLHQIPFFTFKDQVVFEKKEIVKSDNSPFTIFTPYMKRWKLNLNEKFISHFPSETILNHLFKTAAFPFPSLQEIGFKDIQCNFPSQEIDISLIQNYHETRDFPGIEGTSRLGVHLRFGTVSIRKLVSTAIQQNETFLNELIWREFYMMILSNFSNVINKSFKKKYTNLKWLNNEDNFQSWCNGLTGYPLVDAGMRELNETGYMHNRVRMITASFLTKHLLIDWQWGEAYFAEKLLDYELSSNNGGWQWAASTGCDAVPYFRIFNPALQAKKFDPDMKYIRKWIPEIGTDKYPKPIVEHEFARKRALESYKNLSHT